MTTYEIQARNMLKRYGRSQALILAQRFKQTDHTGFWEAVIAFIKQISQEQE
jgi:hypothetical protein